MARRWLLPVVLAVALAAVPAGADPLTYSRSTT
jgi:hypothetical protein